MRVFAAVLLCLVPVPLASAAAIDAASEEEATPWTSLAANDASDNFHFVIVSDRTGGARPGVFESAIPKVNLLEPAFVVSVGDLIEGYTDDQAQLDREWDEFEGFVAGLETPFFYVAGNHDMNNAVMAETWRARFGPSYYRFVYKDVLFLVLNSELFGMVGDPKTPVPGPWKQAEQLAFVEETLAEHPDSRWTIVLVHQPLWDYADGPRGDWPKVEAMLGKRDYTVFAGHFHRYVKNVRQDRKYITLATTGGGSSLRGGIYGEFDHVAWVTMTADGPRIANLLLDGIHDENVVTGASRAAVRLLAGNGPEASAALRSVPVFGEGTHFDSGHVAFELRNGSARSIRLAYNVDQGPDLRYIGHPQAQVVPPGQTARVELSLSAARPVPYASLAPGRVEWTLSTDTADGPVQLTRTSALLPTTLLPMPSGAAPTVDGSVFEDWPELRAAWVPVDGSLEDWPELPFRVFRQGDVAAKQTARTDISYTFSVREAGGNVYLAARVIDDDVFASTALGADVQDAFVIFADARPEPERSANLPLYPATVAGHLARMALARVTLAPAAPDDTSERLAESLAAVRWQTGRTGTGYVVEAEISGEFLDAQAGQPWRHVRLGVVAVDWDEDEAHNRIPWHVRGSAGAALHWQPNRFGDAPVAGTGTFVRGD